MTDITEKRLEKLKKSMLERQRVLQGEVADQRSRTAEEGNENALGGVGDAGDESVLRMMTDLHLHEAGRDLEELREIESALQRIESGDYGECEECGNEIGYARLEAQPTATRCVECQAQHEKTYAHKNTPTM